MKNRPKILPKKRVSYNELLRENKRLSKIATTELEKSKINYQALCIVATKLYAAEPEDEVFTNGTFQPEVLDVIKKEAERRQEEFANRLQETVAETQDPQDPEKANEGK